MMDISAVYRLSERIKHNDLHDADGLAIIEVSNGVLVAGTLTKIVSGCNELYVFPPHGGMSTKITESRAEDLLIPTGIRQEQGFEVEKVLWKCVPGSIPDAISPTAANTRPWRLSAKGAELSRVVCLLCLHPYNLMSINLHLTP